MGCINAFGSEARRDQPAKSYTVRLRLRCDLSPAAGAPEKVADVSIAASKIERDRKRMGVLLGAVVKGVDGGMIVWPPFELKEETDTP